MTIHRCTCGAVIAEFHSHACPALRPTGMGAAIPLIVSAGIAILVMAGLFDLVKDYL